MKEEQANTPTEGYLSAEAGALGSQQTVARFRTSVNERNATLATGPGVTLANATVQ